LVAALTKIIVSLIGLIFLANYLCQMIEAGQLLKESSFFYRGYTFQPSYFSLNSTSASLLNYFADNFLIILLTQILYDGRQTNSRQKKFIPASLVGQ
jgi:hypothetical protein